jgi:putative spermidine/putrescine transport system substrate-binding protein
MAKGAADPDAVNAYMDAAISAAAQSTLAAEPTGYIPTNKDVAFNDIILQFVTPEQLANASYPDWEAINKHRAEWTVAFDRTVAI